MSFHFLQDVAALAVILSIVVFVHEFGHFATAKLFGFPVEVFSFGFGKRLFGVRWRGTDYRVSALPFGGYVRVTGLGPDESTAVGAVEPTPKLAGTRWQRGLIMLAGPVMNFLLAILVQTGVFLKGREVPAYLLAPPVIEAIVPNSSAAAAGFRKGDRIFSIDGSATLTWQDAEFLFAINPRQTLPVDVVRGAEHVALLVTPEGISKFDVGKVDVGPALPVVIRRVLPRGGASAAGVQAGDVVVSINGETMDGVPEVMDAINRLAPGPEAFVVRRGGREVALSVSPRREAAAWKIGVELFADVAVALEKYPPREAVRQGWRRLRTDTQATFGVILKLFRGRASMKQMSGPIAIGQFAGEAAREGAVPFITLLGALSLQLGILNLLPIPMLDGGQLAIIVIEGVLRRDFSLRVKERILQLGFALLVLLMVVVIYNDVLKVL